MASPTRWTWVWDMRPTPGVGDGQGSLVCFSPWGCKESDTTEPLNWTDDLPPSHLSSFPSSLLTFCLDLHFSSTRPQATPRLPRFFHTTVASLSRTVFSPLPTSLPSSRLLIPQSIASPLLVSLPGPQTWLQAASLGAHHPRHIQRVPNKILSGPLAPDMWWSHWGQGQSALWHGTDTNTG